MSTFALVHGAASQGWHWHPTADRLRARGHEVLVPDLPVADPDKGLADYADVVAEAIGERIGVVLVTHSMAGLLVPPVAARAPVAMLVLVAGMVPEQGEPPGQWWEATGHRQAQREHDLREGRDPDAPFDPSVGFFHDVPPGLREAAVEHLVAQSDRPFREAGPSAAWPDVPTRFLLCRDDRLFPAEFLRRVVRDRLGFDPDEMGGGHFPMLSRPAEVADRLERYGEAA